VTPKGFEEPRGQGVKGNADTLVRIKGLAKALLAMLENCLDNQNIT